jgi:hypothetical protein
VWGRRFTKSDLVKPQPYLWFAAISKQTNVESVVDISGKLLRLEAVEKPAREGDLSNGAHHGTFLPTHKNTVGRSYDEHYPVLSNGFDRGAMDIALGPAPGAEMATGWTWASAV